MINIFFNYVCVQWRTRGWGGGAAVVQPPLPGIKI